MPQQFLQVAVTAAHRELLRHALAFGRQLVGEGAYEGLSAMIVNRYVSSTEELEGFIFERALPPIPDPIDPDSPGYAE